MNLPVLVGTDGAPEVVVSVDGAWGAKGLNLSHWPGNATPARFRHDLSTGSALAFARLPADEQRELAAGAEAIANNHYDTDGTLALFAVRHPELALPRADAMLAAAAAGDFFELPSEHGFVVDAIVGGVTGERSPLATELEGASDRERHERATAHLFEVLPALLDGNVDDHRALWEESLERLRRDLAATRAARRHEHADADLTLWRAGEPWPDGGPGRHALFGSSPRDRVLAVAPSSGGTTYRLVISTRSWFDLADNANRRAAGRPDLERLAATLNELEGTDPNGDVAWRAQKAAGASPELWFGTDDLDLFAEHSAALLPSSLDPREVTSHVTRVLASAMP